MRHSAGPFWLWSNLDPDYWYLFDSLNMVNGEWPKHIAHPGTTAQWIGAVLIKALHPFESLEEVNRLVLTQPEHYLTLIGRILIGFNTVALVIVGMVGYLVFRDLTAALLLQTGPFLSKLIFKWSVHVSPEPLLITVVIALGIVTVLALRKGQLKNHRNRYALAFAIIAGFGMATKVTSAGLYLMPVILLWNIGAVVRYGLYAFIALIVFTLPAFGAYEAFLDRMAMISSSSGFHGTGAQTFIDFATYPRSLLRVASRPVFFVVLVIGVGLLIALLRKCRREEKPVPVIGCAMAGLCLAYIGQALLIAKHPAGHYMVPALCFSGLGLALIYQLSKEFLPAEGAGLKRLNWGFSILLLVLVFAQGSSLMKLNREFSQRTANAEAIDETPYEACARIYFWPASHPLYGLFMGSWNTEYSFDDELNRYYPEKSVMFYTNDGELHGLKGLREPEPIAYKYPCIYLRGERPDGSLKKLQDAWASYPEKAQCQLDDEVAFTWGIDCSPSNK